MMTLSPKQGAAMATQVQRVNDDSPEAEIERLCNQIEFLKMQIRTAEERAEHWRQIVESHAPAAPVRSSWVITSDYCKSHNVNMTYLNRALNGKDGYRLDIPGKRSATGRWLVNSAAVFTHSKKARAQKPE